MAPLYIREEETVTINCTQCHYSSPKQAMVGKLYKKGELVCLRQEVAEVDTK